MWYQKGRGGIPQFCRRHTCIAPKQYYCKQGPDLIELRLTNWKGGGVFGSPEYTWMGFLDDLKHLIELELYENVPILELCENNQILDVLTEYGFWPLWP